MAQQDPEECTMIEFDEEFPLNPPIDDDDERLKKILAFSINNII